MQRVTPITPDQMAYRDAGLKVLHTLLPDCPVYEAPELQAVYNWCLAQNWQATAAELEEYGPVIGLAMALGDQIALGIAADWVWVEDPEGGWIGPSLKLRGYAMFCHPVPMMTRRLHDQFPSHIDSLIRDTIANLEGLVASGQATPDPASGEM